MSLSKKDPSLRVAANDPHLVSLGGGRLSTAVTIHNIPVGDTSIGSSTQCNISLSGPGVKPVHCTLYRSEENQVTLVPERDARILIDGLRVDLEVDLKQGAMITLGESYYLRYNNPAEALQMRTAMGDLLNDLENESAALDYFYETNINPVTTTTSSTTIKDSKDKEELYGKPLNNTKSFDLNGWQCPKVFKADLVTVNMPANVVLGQKYANFAKNLAENHRKEKYNNSYTASIQNSEGLYVNIPINPQVKSLTDSSEFLIQKVQNTSSPQRQFKETKESQESLGHQNKDYLDDMLKLCSEYSERQERCGGGSLSSSPVIQNRIKTNGSLPRDKKSPFFQEFTMNHIQNSLNSSNSSLSASPSKSSGYENVRFPSCSIITNSPKSSGYENVKFIPQSPRTKIRTNCLSPKKDNLFSSHIFSKEEKERSEKSHIPYEDLLKNFEEKFQKEIEAIEECSRAQSVNSKTLTLSANNTPIAKRTNKNINNLTIDLQSLVSPRNSPLPLKKPTPAPRNLTSKLSQAIKEIENLDNKKKSSSNNQSRSQSQSLQMEREELLKRLHNLKMEISLLQQQDNEALIEMDMENALVLAELQSLNEKKLKLEQEFHQMQQNTYRQEAQRNATRVMEENQQAKLKQSIEMKQDQILKLKEMLEEKLNNECLKEELQNVQESLENDRKAFEDLEFQYLEGESEWQDLKEELNLNENKLLKELEDTKKAIYNLENPQLNTTTTSEQQNNLRKRLVALLNDLQQCEMEFKKLEKKLSFQMQNYQNQKPLGSSVSLAVMSQSLFGSTEMLCPKTNSEDLMSKSFNENLIFNNKIETPSRESQEHLAATKSLSNSFRNSREASIKLLESIKEIERNRQLLATKPEYSVLEQEKRKLEDILTHLNREGKSAGLKEEEKENTKISQNLQENQKAKKDSLLKNENPLTEKESSQRNSQQLERQIKTQSISDKRSSSVMSNNSERDRDRDRDSCLSIEKRKSMAKNQRPLTRYMPIYNQDLDLRRHIESAGHQISMCPHIFLDSFACRGYLHKLGSTFHTWSKRWFVLDRQRQAFIYYYDKSERKPRGGAYFSSIDEVYMDHLNASKSSRPHCTFIVKTKKRLYYLQAASDSAARIWIDAIITGAQGNMDY